MKLLFDHNVDRRFRRHISGHEICTTREMRWEDLGNGALLKAAADAKFNAVITVDKRIEHEQNLSTLPLPIVILNTPSNALPALIPFAPLLMNLLSARLANMLFIIEPTGIVRHLTAPRP